MAKKTSKLWFVWPDTHFPEQDDEAVECAYRAHEILKPDNTILLGDMMDCEIFSTFTRRKMPDTVGYDFQEKEVDPLNALLDDLQHNTKQHTFFLEGNHEERIERWAANNGQVAQALFGVINPNKLIATGRRNFTMIPYTVPTGDRKGYVNIAKDLVAVHGWSWAKNAAQIHLDASRTKSVVFGHTHRHQVASSRDPWTGKPIKAFSPGCLCKLNPLYSAGGAPKDWTHGFGVIYVGRHSWTEYNISIHNGSCVLPDGTEIK